MRFVKHFCSLFLTVILICLSINITFSAQNTDFSRFGRTVLGKMSNPEGLLYVYDCLVKGCAESEKDIYVYDQNKKITTNEITTVFLAFQNDYPEYFWVGGNYNCSYDISNYVHYIYPDYTITGDSLEKAKTTFNNKVNSLTKDLDGKSDYEKSLIIHDRLINSVAYSRSNNDQNAYGAIVEGKAVCAGYARAYQYLMIKVGMPSWVVTGKSINPLTGNSEAHAWNLVSVDGEWYYTDVTWDDQAENNFYTFLNVTTEQIEEGHTAEHFASYLPTASSTDANYFFRNRLICFEFSADTVAQMLKDGGNKTRIYVTGDVDSFKTEINNNLDYIVKKTGATDDSGYSYSCSALGRELILTVNIIESNHQHKLTAVSGKEPSCIAEGNLAYYICTCGKWFNDANAQIEITDRTAVKLLAVSHSPSGWKFDNNSHWKECTFDDCYVEIADTMAYHSDTNSDDKCDVCGTAIATPQDKITSSVISNGETESDNTVYEKNKSDENIIIEEETVINTVSNNMKVVIVFVTVIFVLLISMTTVLIIKKK